MSAAGGRLHPAPLRAVHLRAPAKVNLHLEVIARRPDGYHEIETILQAVTLYDRVSVALLERFSGRSPRIEMVVRPAGVVPADSRNLCWQAARAFCREAGVGGRLRIELEKEIPVMAGLGGGSSDAAAVLAACDRLFATGWENPRLEALGAEIGSDVPFFVRGGTQLGRGRGTELRPLPMIRNGVFLIVKPDIRLETAKVYGNLKMGLTHRSPRANIQAVKPLIVRFPTSSWFGFNRLEEVVLPSYPELQRLVLQLRDIAPVAMLSGSGAAVVAVFDEKQWDPKFAAEFARSSSFVRVVSPHTAGVQFRED
jgi:4-diphosphocytidyl-2-C-methyl-D-erythritol kinase